MSVPVVSWLWYGVLVWIRDGWGLHGNNTSVEELREAMTLVSRKDHR